MKLADIPIQRFQAGLPLARDTFLYLPLNNKSLRLGFAGDSLSEQQLSRLIAKGHAFLRVEIREGEEIDAQSFPVHISGESSVEAPITPAAALQAEELPGVTDTTQIITTDGEIDASTTLVRSSAEEAESTSSFKAGTNSPLEEQKFKAGTAEVEPSTRLSATDAPPEETTRLSASPPETEDSAAFRAERNSENSTKVQGKKGAPEPEESFRADVAAAEEENSFAAAQNEEVEENFFGAEKEKKVEEARRFSAEKEALPAIFRLQKRLADPNANERTIDLKQEKKVALDEARTVILSSKISEKIISLSEKANSSQPELRSALRGQIRSLREALDRVEGGKSDVEKDADEETREEIQVVGESLSSATRVDQITEISERLTAHALTKEMARAAIEAQEKEPEIEKEAGTSNRDLPSTVSRLATYLGHSLGYTNVDFLADLACGAILHFARKDGQEFDQTQLPTLSKKLFFDSPVTVSQDVIDDSRDIMLFLDAYLNDKECDRSHRDLIKKIFDRTAEGFGEKEDGPSPWNLKKWSAFVNRGSTMDSHSICTRAAAKALKTARSATL